MFELEALTRTMLDAIDDVGAALVERTRTACANALLAVSDPGLALPSPPVALMEFDTDETATLDRRALLRSELALKASGEILVTPVCGDIVVHPWRIESAEWIMDDPRDTGEDDPRVARGVVCRLRRSPASTCTPGPLTVHVGVDPAVVGSLRRSIATARAIDDSDTQRLLVVDRKPETYLATRVPVGPTTTDQQVAAQEETLVSVYVTRELCERESWTLELRFARRALAVSSTPSVTANVHSVWNSLWTRYPERASVQQTVSENRNRWVHALGSRDVGSSWRAWSVVRVGTSRRLHSATSWFASTGRSPATDTPALLLAYVGEQTSHPERQVRATSPTPVLSIVVDATTRRHLDDARTKLTAEYWITTGADGNGVPAGTAFHVDSPLSARLQGRLVTSMWGGTDGAMGHVVDFSGDEQPSVFVAPRGLLTVTDAMNIIARASGGMLDVVDPRDFLRWGAASPIEPLVVRVRFRDRVPGHQGGIVLAACRGALEQRMGSAVAAGLVLTCDEMRDGVAMDVSDDA